ncbi:hypothetical protein FB451DRAFT_1028777, partial [Mycena latifolia]
IPHYPVSDHWPELSSLQRKAVCTVIAGIWHQLLSLRFDAIGSLHIDPTGKIDIGPVAVQNCKAPTPEIEYPKCGPFTTLREWLSAVAKHDVGFRYPATARDRELMANAIQIVDNSPLFTSSPSPPDPMDDDFVSTFVLMHIDLRPRNILVSPEDPTIITCVIDWEGVKITPIWNAYLAYVFMEENV